MLINQVHEGCQFRTPKPCVRRQGDRRKPELGVALGLVDVNVRRLLAPALLYGRGEEFTKHDFIFAGRVELPDAGLLVIAIDGLRSHQGVFSCSGFCRPKIDTDGAKCTRARRLRGILEDIGFPGDLEPSEPSGDDRRLELCLQQSASDSTGPEVYLFLGFLGHCPLDQDVSNLKPPT